MGCYEDTADRAMLMKRVDDFDAMTVRKCLAICAKDGKSQMKVVGIFSSVSPECS